MGRDQITARQLMILLFLELLSPGVQLTTGWAARKAGAAGWLAGVGAIPLLLLVIWMVGRLTRGLPEGQGLADGLLDALGPVAGRIVVALYALWELVRLTTGLRLYGQKVTMDYDDERLWFCLIVLCAVAVWIASGRLAAFARAGEIFYLAMCALLILLLGAGVLQIDVLNLAPVSFDELAGVPAAVGEAAAILSAGIYGGFLLAWLPKEERGRALPIRWTVKFCLVLAAVQLVILGGMGAALTQRTEMPLFTLARDMSIGSTIQRLEGVVVSIWILSDLVMVGLRLFLCAALLRRLLGIRGKYLPLFLGVAALAGGEWWFSDPWKLRQFGETVLLAGNVVMAFLVPLAAVVVKKIRRRGQHGGISCTPPGKLP